MESQGVLVSEPAVAVASAYYDPESDENVRLTTSEVENEAPAMMDTSIRIAPKRRLCPMKILDASNASLLFTELFGRGARC